MKDTLIDLGIMGMIGLYIIGIVIIIVPALVVALASRIKCRLKGGV